MSVSDGVNIFHLELRDGQKLVQGTEVCDGLMTSGLFWYKNDPAEEAWLSCRLDGLLLQHVLNNFMKDVISDLVLEADCTVLDVARVSRNPEEILLCGLSPPMGGNHSFPTFPR